MTTYKISFPIFIIVSLIGTGPMFGQSSQQATAPKQAVSGPADTKKSTSADTAVNQIVDKIVAREAALAAVMKDMHPLVETYLQTLEKDDELAFHPTGDQYFLGKLEFNPGQIRERTFMNQANKSANIASSIAAGFKQMYSVRYLPEGFEQMLVVSGGFDRNTYNFEYVRREFLGAVRCLVFDVTAKKGGSGTFKGRIWAEDQDYNIVRFNGTYGPSTLTKMFFHFDSWREYMGPAMWRPASSLQGADALVGLQRRQIQRARRVDRSDRGIRSGSR